MASFEDLSMLLKGMSFDGEKAAIDCAEAIKILIEDEFEAQSDPYGTKWKPLAPATVRRKKSSIILIHTGGMLDSLSVVAKGDSIEISLDLPAVHHQFGTKHMPARPILPTDELPESWQNKIAKACLG